MHRESDPAPTHDAIVVGAGFAGLYAMHLLRSRGLDVVGLEAGSDIGGTWYWNRYPGARCDVVSTEYCYSFDPVIEQGWRWRERFAAQPEILAYLGFVAERLDLRRSFVFGTRVDSLEWADGVWHVTTDDGAVRRARHCILAVGNLSLPQVPDFPGLEDFEGDTYHTGLWPHEEPDFAGRRVGVIGTGSSGIQVITELAKQADELTVFQRTAHYALPNANRPLADEELATIRADYPRIRQVARSSRAGISILPEPTRAALDVPPAERTAAYAAAYAFGTTLLSRLYTDLATDLRANQTAAAYIRQRIQERVDDPRIAELLAPRDYPLGSKRVCLEDGYYETFNKANVHLVDVRSDPIERLTARGVRTRAAEHPLDAVVFATGYDAMTGSILAMDIRGEGGVALSDEWASGPRAHLGLMSAGFPNLYMITGPGSPSVLVNMVLAIEQHVEFVVDLLDWMAEHGLDRVEAEQASQDAWVDSVNALADGTVLVAGDSWYVGANIPGKPRVFIPFAGGLGAYRRIAEKAAADGYQGFRFASASRTGATAAQASRSSRGDR